MVGENWCRACLWAPIPTGQSKEKHSKSLAPAGAHVLLRKSFFFQCGTRRAGTEHACIGAKAQKPFVGQATCAQTGILLVFGRSRGPLCLPPAFAFLSLSPSQSLLFRGRQGMITLPPPRLRSARPGSWTKEGERGQKRPSLEKKTLYAACWHAKISFHASAVSLYPPPLPPSPRLSR